MLFSEYTKVLIFFIVSFIVISILVFLPKYLNKKFVWKNVFRPVECGSHSFGSGKNKIEIIFYRVLIVFIIFEIEILILIPWIFNFYLTIKFSTLPMGIFFITLLLGYMYEYSRGVFKFK